MGMAPLPYGRYHVVLLKTCHWHVFARYTCRSRSILPPQCQQKIAPKGAIFVGAGDGNRTHVASLGSWGSAIELHPRTQAIIAQSKRFAYP